ncbi:MAG TPA: hypothetical protein VFI91_11415 [Longimicrobiaceae bacterium]|nr:hypothetical protein [Longimicrobiaceae bacterium]
MSKIAKPRTQCKNRARGSPASVALTNSGNQHKLIAMLTANAQHHHHVHHHGLIGRWKGVLRA